MFQCSMFNQDISKWDTRNVKSMENMFYGSLFNQDISTWNTIKVVSMYRMFEESKFNQDIGNWNISNLNNENSSIFSNSAFNHNIYRWTLQKPNLDFEVDEKLLKYDYTLRWIEYNRKVL